MPVQLSFLSEQKAEPRVPQHEDRRDWQLAAVPNGSPAAAKPRLGSPSRPSAENKVLHAIPMSKESQAPKHDIWGTLEQLDASIQRRNKDMRTFTESLLSLQAESHAPPSYYSPDPHALSEFFYA